MSGYNAIFTSFELFENLLYEFLSVHRSNFFHNLLNKANFKEYDRSHEKKKAFSSKIQAGLIYKVYYYLVLISISEIMYGLGIDAMYLYVWLGRSEYIVCMLLSSSRAEHSSETALSRSNS